MNKVYVVSVPSKNEKSNWSSRGLAMAEVRSVKNKLFPDDSNAIGKDVFFKEDMLFVSDRPEDVDTRSIAYGSDWKKQNEFEEATK